MKRGCELCKQTARVHCEPDQASLCWDCDAKVHSANFLVARHSRNLLCRLCQLPTPWSALGSHLEPTFAVCRSCIDRRICDRSVEEEAVDVEIGVSTPPPASESSSSCEEADSDGEVVDSNSQPFDDDDHNVPYTKNIQRRPSNSVTETRRASEISTPPKKIRRRRNP